MVQLSACMKAGQGFPKTAKEALRAFGAAAQHKAFGLVLLKTQGTVSYPGCGVAIDVTTSVRMSKPSQTQ